MLYKNPWTPPPGFASTFLTDVQLLEWLEAEWKQVGQKEMKE